jgi:hypothetical protein
VSIEEMEPALAGKEDLEPAPQGVRRDQDQEGAKGIGLLLFRDFLDEAILQVRMERA